MEELSVVRGMVELSPTEEGRKQEWSGIKACPASQVSPPNGSTASQSFNISFLIRKKILV